jgi:hypothetical protein
VKLHRLRSRDARLLREQLLAELGYCAYCGIPLTRHSATLDHYLPHSRGGRNRASNFRLACFDCNAAKADRLPHVFRCFRFLTSAKGSNMNVVGFNYESLEQQDRDCLAGHAKAIRAQLEKTSAAVADIGRRLIAVRERVGQRNFQAWIRASFGWSQPVASNYMQLAKKFGDLDCLPSFQPSALFALARQTVPPAAVKQAIAEAKTGRVISKQRANEIVGAHCDRLARPYVKPQLRDALTRLRHSLVLMAEDADAVAAIVSPAEMEQLLSQLLVITQRLRQARRRELPAPA